MTATTPGCRPRTATPPGDAPPGRPATPRRPVLGALAVALVAGGLLAGCSGGSSSAVSCRGADCRATVTGTPVQVDQPDANQSSRSRARTNRAGSGDDGAIRPNRRHGVDFVVNAVGPGWAEVAAEGPVTRIPQGGTFVDSGSTVRLESSDGRTAVFTFRRR